MERVIELLKEKNVYLEKFFLVNEHELINLGSGDFENVEAFYQARDKILELIAKIDESIEQHTRTLVGEAVEAQRTKVTEILAAKDELVQQILSQDLQIIAYIEKEKSNIIRELHAANLARRAAGAYANAERLQQLED